MTKDQLWNLADCATRRGVRAFLEGDKVKANGEFDAAESYQRRHSYTVIDLPIGCGPPSALFHL
jgi:hypothetical protein